jgi:hypothetical protein
LSVDWNSRNETLKTTRRISPLIITMVILVAVVVAAVTLSISNTATINPAGSPVAVGPETSTTACSSSTGTYSPTVSLAWGSVNAGTTVTEYICVENTGTGSYTLQFTTNLPASDGTVSSAQTGSAIPAGGFLLVDLSWAISSSAPTGSVTFTISFQ